VGICHGAGFSTNFNSGYDNTQAVAGQNGWSINDSTADLSFFVTYNFTDAAAVGGYYDAPALPDVRLSHGVSLPLVQTSLGADFAIVPSTLSFPGRDTFGWSFYNGSGSNLLTIMLEPDTSNPVLLNATWSTGAGGMSSTGLGVEYNGPYSFHVEFSNAGGGNAAFTATLVGANSVSWSGTLPGMANETLASFGENWRKGTGAAGDNYMLMDNVFVVPEPSSIFILAGSVAVPLLARRRRTSR
jgi:hypothetical protein